MKVMFICGVFAKENEGEILAHSKRLIEYAANIFQTKMIRGFQEIGVDIQVLSAPFIGSFPNASDVFRFSGFSDYQEQYTYVHFNNCWGIRNLSRAASLKRALSAFIMERDTEKLIVLYTPHTPFLQAAAYAKRKDPNIRICMVVPDLPQYMNLDAKISTIYKVGKKWDIAHLNSLIHYVDSFVLLTEAMKDKLRVGDKPYKVVEGLIDEESLTRNEEIQIAHSDDCHEKYIVYTGKTNERFGVKKLVDAFLTIDDPEFRLVLCGKGDCDGYIQEKSAQDNRILALGQVPHEVAMGWIQKASALVNPRENDEEYTKYSFPSKTIEYLASGNPTVGYMLDGMPAIYGDLLFTADRDGLAKTIKRALDMHQDEKIERSLKAREYLETLSAKSVANTIINLTFVKEEECCK